MNGSQTEGVRSAPRLLEQSRSPSSRLAWDLFFVLILSVPWVKLEIIGRIVLSDVLFVLMALVFFTQYALGHWKLSLSGPPPKIFLLCLSLWIIAVILSGFNAPYKGAYLVESLGLVYLSAFGLAFAAFAAQNETLLEAVVRGVKYSVAVVILVGFVGVLLAVGAQQFNSFFYSEAQKLIATFRFPNQLGGFLVLFLPLIWEEVARPGRTVRRWGYVLLLIFLCVDLVASGSRSALMAALFAGMVYLFWNVMKVHIRWALGAIVFILVSYAVALVLSNYIGVVQRALGALDSVFLQGQLTDEFRLTNWALAFSIFQEFPWVGYGAGNIQYDYAFEIHNSYLSVLAEMGIAGVIALVCLLSFVGFTAWQNVRLALNLSSPLWLGTTRAFFVGFLTEALYLTQHQMLRSRFLWLVFGVIVAINLVLRQKYRTQRG